MPVVGMLNTAGMNQGRQAALGAVLPCCRAADDVLPDTPENLMQSLRRPRRTGHTAAKLRSSGATPIQKDTLAPVRMYSSLSPITPLRTGNACVPVQWQVYTRSSGNFSSSFPI